MANAIETKNLKKTYLMGNVEVPALKGIDLAIKKGEFVSIMGPSGSGKSTLLNMIGMLDTPTSGKVLIDGVDVSFMSESERADFRLKKLGFVFQFFSLFIEMTALENVMLPMILNGTINEERAIELLKMVNMDDRAIHRPNELSGGEQQRVSIARALSNGPTIILADEPTGNLDTKTSEQILDVMGVLNKKTGQTIVMVTHDPDLGKKADRIIQIRDGLVAF